MDDPDPIPVVYYNTAHNIVKMIETNSTTTLCFRMEFTTMVGVLIGFISIVSIFVGLTTCCERRDKLDIWMDRYMYYVKNSRYSISRYPWAPERCILVELVKITLLVVACLGMFGVVAKPTVNIVWFAYDVSVFIDILLVGAFLKLEPQQSTVTAMLYPYFYTEIMLYYGLQRTYHCALPQKMQYVILASCVFATYFIRAKTAREYPIIFFAIWFILFKSIILTVYGPMPILVLNVGMICVPIVFQGSLFRFLPELVAIFSAVVGFSAFAIYHKQDPDFLEDLSLPVTQLIIALLLINLSLTVVYDSVVYGKSSRNNNNSSDVAYVSLPTVADTPEEQYQKIA